MLHADCTLHTARPRGCREACDALGGVSPPPQCVNVPCRPGTLKPRPTFGAGTRPVQPRPPRPGGMNVCGPQGLSSYLLPRVVGSGRQWLRRTVMRLCIEQTPEGTEAPYTLLSVCVSSAPPMWEMLPGLSPGGMQLRVSVPLVCQVRDGRGRSFQVETNLETQVSMRLACGAAECWRYSVMLVPCVHLCGRPCPTEDGCIEAQLEVMVDAYLTRWEPCAPRPRDGGGVREVPIYPQMGWEES